MNHVHDFAAPTAVSAAYDDEMRALLRRTLQDESADGRSWVTPRVPGGVGWTPWLGSRRDRR